MRAAALTPVENVIRRTLLGLNDGSKAPRKRYLLEGQRTRQMVRGLGLWMLGVPVTVIILIALFTNFI